MNLHSVFLCQHTQGVVARTQEVSVGQTLRLSLTTLTSPPASDHYTLYAQPNIIHDTLYRDISYHQKSVKLLCTHGVLVCINAYQHTLKKN